MLLTSLQGTGEGETLHLRLTRSGSTMRVLHTTEMGKTKELPQSPGSEQSLTLETTPKPPAPFDKAQGQRFPSTRRRDDAAPHLPNRWRGAHVPADAFRMHKERRRNPRLKTGCVLQSGWLTFTGLKQHSREAKAQPPAQARGKRAGKGDCHT